MYFSSYITASYGREAVGGAAGDRQERVTLAERATRKGAGRRSAEIDTV